MQTAREWAGGVEEETLGAGVRPGVSLGPPLPWGCQSLAKKRSVAGTKGDFPSTTHFQDIHIIIST